MKPSWAVTKLTEVYGDRPSSAYRSPDPASREAMSRIEPWPAPEVAQRVAVAVVPLHPRRRERPHLVAVHRRVPRLGDQLHVPQHRVLVDRGEERAVHVDVVPGAGQRRGEVEAEPVDVHLGDPVAQRVHDEPQRAEVGGVDGVAAAGDVPVGVAHRARALVEADVVEPAEGVRRPVRPALGGVVVDDVEDHLDAGGVEVLHHLLELGDLLRRARRSAEYVDSGARNAIVL